ncbi:hypothetical protein [Sphingosinicella terrae]|jgi:hypothetical protein|uniref:hypothetical protein n=1 Tax=Sphingosinicella terrae TaxID=2172047 RepID=UPI000E0DAE04|nr:hypothetical protein [Sphingosinicella terrae]
MFDANGRMLAVRSNQAVLPSSDLAGRARTGDRAPMAGPWASHRPGLLSRMARAARDVVHEARASGDVPLPHLYRGRDYHKERQAA